jgi:hypothetical protein
MNKFFNFKKGLVVAIIALIFFNTWANKSYSQDELWQKAINVAEKSRNYKAKDVLTHIYELEKDGSVKSETTIYQKLKTGLKTEYDTYKVIKDGIDITEESLKKIKNKKSNNSFFDDTNFFLEKSQKKMTTKKIASENLNGINCSVYNLVFKKDKKTSFKGKAWLNDNNGKPVKVSFGITPLPLGVKEMSISFTYGSGGENSYIEKIEAEGKAGILFFEKYFKTRTELKNFQ